MAHKPEVVAGIAWFRADQWPLLRSLATDAEDLEETYEQWVKIAEKTMEAVSEPEVHISGDIAWITYVNHGSIKDAYGTKDVTWLESAVLQRELGTWRIHFFHSTRAPEKKLTGTPMLNFPVVTPSGLQARAPSAAAADLASR